MKLSLCEKVQTFNFTDSFLVLSVPDKTQPDANISPVQYFDEVTQLVLNQNISKELFKSIFFKFIFSDISKELFEIYIFKFIIQNCIYRTNQRYFAFTCPSCLLFIIIIITLVKITYAQFPPSLQFQS